MSRIRVAATLLACVGLALAAPALATVQQGYGSAESASEALARNVRLLASNQRNFQALIGAGKAALELGDTQAAAGFFGRAEEVSPRSPLPQIGMGAALAQSGDAQSALRYFSSALQLGATPSMLGLDRGLAYDLLGRHSEAQADYRAAIARGGEEGDEARRRLALSLAITGNRDEALALLGPLVARGDASGARCRALALALTGDAAGARAALNAAMPGSASQMDYFFRKLPALRSDQKAAAVHLGIFPDSAQLAYAPAPQPGYGTTVSASVATAPATGDRLADIERLLSGHASSQPVVSAQTAVAQPQSLPMQNASLPQVRRQQTGVAAEISAKRFWVQLASGTNAAALPDQFRKLQQRDREMLGTLKPYVAEDGGRVRLLVGPFRNTEDAQIFAENLESSRIDAFSWVAKPGQTIRKLSTE